MSYPHRTVVAGNEEVKEMYPTPETAEAHRRGVFGGELFVRVAVVFEVNAVRVTLWKFTAHEGTRRETSWFEIEPDHTGPRETRDSSRSELDDLLWLLVKAREWIF